MRSSVVGLKREIAVLDLGTSTIKVAIGKSEPSRNSTSDNFDIRIIGSGYQQTNGLKVGAIKNLEKLEDSILSAISEAESEAQRKIKTLAISLPMWMCQSKLIERTIDIGNVVIDEIHISELQCIDKNQYFSEPLELIHAIPIEYSVDNQKDIIDPKGMVGEKLSVRLLLIVVPKFFINNIKNCLYRNNIEISGYVASSLASSLVFNKNKNCEDYSIVDIGGTTTDITIVKNGKPYNFYTINMGSQNITKDISTVLKTTLAGAERLKILYGVASFANQTNESLIISRIDDDGDEHMTNVSRNTLDSIVLARVEEIFEVAKIKSNMLSSQKVFLTGGGARLSGLIDIVKLRKFLPIDNIRIGKPLNIHGSDDIVKTSTFINAIGAIYYHMTEHKAKLNINKKSFFKHLISWVSRGT